MKILVGSNAARFWLPQFRIGKDIDWWSTEGVEGEGFDTSIIPENILTQMQKGSIEGGVATLDDLLTIKLSHLPYDIMWYKHLNDYLVFKKYGATVNQKLYVALQEHWKAVHGNKSFLSLYKTKDKFFDDYVVKEQEHDHLHKLVSYPNKPVYTLCLKEGEDVAIDKEKFLSLQFDQQIRMFREEINVIALERWVFPSKESIPFIHAYGKSLHKTVTQLTKNWASTYLCENIELFIKPNRKEVEHAMKVLNV